MWLRILFFAVLALEIFFSETSERAGVWILKPLLMPILIWIAYQKTIKDKYLYLALIFSLLGDVFLMFSGENYFILGLGSFLTAHVFYILLYKKQFQFSWIKTLPFLLSTLTYFLFIKGSIPSDLMIPVLAYCLVITTMGIFAAGRVTSDNSYKMVLLGSILFIISDSLIAFNKFVSPLDFSSLWVMSTYGLAQFLIVIGWKN